MLLRLAAVAALATCATALGVHSVHSVIVSTSVARTTPSLDHLRACVSAVASHPALADVPLYVVADAIPTAAEAASLPSVDRDKWAPLWAAMVLMGPPTPQPTSRAFKPGARPRTSATRVSCATSASATPLPLSDGEKWKLCPQPHS